PASSRSRSSRTGSSARLRCVRSSRCWGNTPGRRRASTSSSWKRFRWSGPASAHPSSRPLARTSRRSRHVGLGRLPEDPSIPTHSLVGSGGGATERRLPIVVIPCYNEARRLDLERLGKLVRSERLGLLFVNDGSTDETGRI